MTLLSETTLFIPMKPAAKGRPRFSGLSGAVYTPRRTKQAERTLRVLLLDAYRKPRLKGAVSLSLEITLHGERAGYKVIVGEVDTPTPPTRPDLDNLVKLFLDAANGVLWDDDAQIVHLFAQKG